MVSRSGMQWRKQVKSMGAKGKLGAGGRFHEISEKAGKEYGSMEKGKAVAAAIGMRKYGKKKMLSMAKIGKNK